VRFDSYVALSANQIQHYPILQPGRPEDAGVAPSSVAFVAQKLSFISTVLVPYSRVNLTTQKSLIARKFCSVSASLANQRPLGSPYNILLFSVLQRSPCPSRFGSRRALLGFCKGAQEEY